MYCQHFSNSWNSKEWKWSSNFDRKVALTIKLDRKLRRSRRHQEAKKKPKTSDGTLFMLHDEDIQPVGTPVCFSSSLSFPHLFSSFSVFHSFVFTFPFSFVSFHPKNMNKSLSQLCNCCSIFRSLDWVQTLPEFKRQDLSILKWTQVSGN